VSWLYQVHLARRCLESYYISNFSPTATMHLSHYLLGCSYYVAAPLTMMSCAEQPTMPSAAVFTALALAFLWLNVIQHQCHRTLAALRTPGKNGGAPGGTSALARTYSIPRGGSFEVASCPHYTAEVAIYACLALLCRGSLATVALALFVAIELGFNATMQHAWYHSKFTDYPRGRCAIYPGLL
jgi:3-oxo-5-alpha-steroid 4-dehydrogenase 3